MSSPVPTPPPSTSSPLSQKLLGNLEQPSDLEWSTEKERTKNSTRVRRKSKPDFLDFLRENSSEPSSNCTSRELSRKLDVQNARDSSSSLRIGPSPIHCKDISKTSLQRTTPLRLLSGSTTRIPSSCCPKPTSKPSSTSSKVQESKDKNVKVDRESKQRSQEKKEKDKGDEKEKTNEKKIKEKEPNQERQPRADGKLPTFSRQLNPQEIADDLFAMTVRRPTRKPKLRRPKSVQKQVDQVTPGLWLESIKRNRY